MYKQSIYRYVSNYEFPATAELGTTTAAADTNRSTAISNGATVVWHWINDSNIQ